MADKKVAVITGGASGMGLQVAQSLSKRPDWDIHILDLNTTTGPKTASSISATFHESNVTNYTQLSHIFQTIHSRTHRIDFVFANAGIGERVNFFADHSTTGDSPPPEPEGMHPLIDINLKGVIYTAHLALHYMRRHYDPTADKSLIITASCGAIYPSYYSPIYTSTKHAVLGLTRALAPQYRAVANIRVNAICPGTVKTNLLSEKEWANFPEQYFTPVEKIARVVLMLVDGVDGGEGRAVVQGEEREAEGELCGKAVEVCGERHYYRAFGRYCDEGMRAVMESTGVESVESKGCFEG